MQSFNDKGEKREREFLKAQQSNFVSFFSVIRSCVAI